MTKDEIEAARVRWDVKSLIRFYDERVWDWRTAAEFLLWRSHSRKGALVARGSGGEQM